MRGDQSFSDSAYNGLLQAEKDFPIEIKVLEGNNASDYEPVARMDVPVAEHYIEQLRRIPDFNRAYDVDGMTVEEFETFGPTVKTLRQFLNADADLDKLVRDIIVPEV